MSKFKTKPYKHQLECLNKYGHRESFALLAEMGAGKTKIIIDNAADLWASEKCDALLVFAPNGVHTNWLEREFPAHMPDWCRHHAVAWTSKQRKADKERFETLFETTDELRILTMNWEALQTKRGTEAALRFAQSAGALMLVCDESDAIKNPTAKRTKNLMKLKKHSRWRRIMSGTPITNSPFDAYSQFNFLDSEILQTNSFYAFKAEYAELLQPGNPLLSKIMQNGNIRGVPQIVATGKNGAKKYRNLDKLKALIEPHSFRVLKKDCLDLPPKVYTSQYFELTKEQREVYQTTKDECRLTWNDEETVFNKLVSIGKLAQITSGYFIHPECEVPVKIEGDNPKLGLLKDTIEKIDGSVIIWARYTAEINDIMSELHHERPLRYDGQTDNEQRTEAIRAFQAGESRIFVANQQAGGTGITLTAANWVIYYSNSFSLRDRLQSEDRCHRVGQDKTVTYIDLIGIDTIDEHVTRALQSKKQIADAIIDGKFLR